MSRSYHLNQTLRDFATYQRYGIKPKPAVLPATPPPAPTLPDATRQNEIARAALHATTTDELRTEGKQIKHRTNFHE
jgi:hypothetical protein